MFLASFINNDYTHRPNFYYSKVDLALSVHFAQNAAAHMCVCEPRGCHGNKDQCHRRCVCMFRYLSFCTWKARQQLFIHRAHTHRQGSRLHSLLGRKKLFRFSVPALTIYIKADGATFLPIASLSIIFTRAVFSMDMGREYAAACEFLHYLQGGRCTFSEARKICYRCALGFIVNNIMWIGLAKCVCAVVIKFWNVYKELKGHSFGDDM